MKISKNRLSQIIAEELNLVLEARIHDLLGIDKSITGDALNSAYKKRARQLHPDLNPNDPEKEQQFKELAGAKDEFEKYGETGKPARGQKPQDVPAMQPDLILKSLDIALSREKNSTKKSEIEKQINSVKQIVQSGDAEKIKQIGIAYEKLKREQDAQRAKPELLRNPVAIERLTKEFNNLLNIQSQQAQSKPAQQQGQSTKPQEPKQSVPPSGAKPPNPPINKKLNPLFKPLSPDELKRNLRSLEESVNRMNKLAGTKK